MAVELLDRQNWSTEGLGAAATALEASSVGIAVATLAGSLQYANDAFFKFFGADATAPIASDIRQISRGLLREDFLVSVAREDGPRQVCISVDGPDRETMLLCTVQRIMHGALPIYLSVVVKDITDLADDYRTRVQLLRGVLSEQGMNGGWGWSLRLATNELRRNSIVWVSSTEELFGSRPVPKTLDEFLERVAPHCRERVAAELARAVESRAAYSVDYEFGGEGGATRQMRSVGQYVASTRCSEARMTCVEFERGPLEIRQSHDSMSDVLLANMEAPVARLDRRLRYQYFNPAFVMLMSNTQGQPPLLGRPALDTVADPARRRLLANLLSRVLKGEPAVYEQEIVDERGNPYQWIDFHLKPIRDASGAVDGIMTLGHDVSALKRANFRQEHLNAELQHRLERRTALVDAAHRDLSNRVADVCETLQEDLRQLKASVGSISASDDAGLQLAAAAVTNLESRIRGLARLSGVALQAPEQRSIDMHRIVQEVRRDLSFMLKGRTIDFVVDRLPEAVGDRALVRQVWESLLSNAIKFTQECATPRIHVWAAVEQGVTVWSVADNGIGFDMKTADDMFAAFVRRGRKPQGVGLSVAWRAIQQMNGRLWCESSAGCGATFHFTIGDQG
jgi:signal transduction histidine kinase